MTTPYRSVLLSTLIALCCGVAWSQESADHKVAVNINAPQMPDALIQFTEQLGLQLIYPAGEAAANLPAPKVSGTFSAQETLERLLKNSGLRYEFISPKTVAILSRDPSAAITPQRNGMLRLARNEGVVSSGSQAEEPAENAEQNPYAGDPSIGEIVVTGSYTRGSANSATGLNMTLRETPQSVTVISHERIEDQGLWEVSDVVNQSVGLHYDGSVLGSDSGSFYARGFPVTNFQLDGIPRPHAIYGFQVTTDDMVPYERVEIIRGATGLMNGVGNPSASINLIRKRPTRQFSGNLLLQAGSWHSYRPQVDLGGPLTDGGRIRGRLAAAYQQADSYLDRMNLEKQAAYGIVEADISDNTLLSIGMEYQGLKNNEAPRGGAVPFWTNDGVLANLSRSSNIASNWSVLKNTDLTVFGGLEHRFTNGWSIKLNAEHLTADFDDSMGYIWAGGSSINPISGSGGTLLAARWARDLEQNYVGAYAQGSFELLGRKHELVFGLSTAESSDRGAGYCGWWCGGDYFQTLSSSFFDFLANGNATQPNFSADGTQAGGVITQTAAYAALRLKPTDRIATILGARVTDFKNRRWNETTSGVRTYSPDTKESGVITPYAGIVVDVTKHLSVYASYTQIFQPATQEDINGNILDPLQGNNYEAGLKTEFYQGRLSASLGFFKTEQDNFAVSLGVLNPNGRGAFSAEKGSVSKGFEVEIAGEVLPGWQAVGGFSRADSENRLGAPLLPEIPANSFKLFSSYRFPGNLSGLTLGGNARWQSKVTSRFMPNPVSGEQFEQGSIVVVDLLAKYAVSKKVAVQLNANNLFDKTYFAGVGDGGIYGIPRSVAASVQWIF